MENLKRKLKFSGQIAPDDETHQISRQIDHDVRLYDFTDLGNVLDSVIVEIHDPNVETIRVPQYAPTVIDVSTGYNPASDCNGYFMSFKYQANNNCYAYSCNIATNTFPQPGRASGHLITSNKMNGPAIKDVAVLDGLEFVGFEYKAVEDFRKQRKNGRATEFLDGHFVALLISAPKGEIWPGDYHWVRCDNSDSTLDSWSQKDGKDQVTNFDFSGRTIADPILSTWVVNQGRIASPTSPDFFIQYSFYCFMFVPSSGVNII